MNAPGQPPGGRPPYQQYGFDPTTGQPLAPPTPQPTPQQVYQPAPQQAYQQQYYPQQGQPVAAQPAYQQPQQVMAPAPTPQPMQRAMPGQPAVQPAAMPQPVAAAAYKKKDETLGMVALGLAIAAWILQFHLVMSIPAIIVGFMAKKKIKANPDQFGGGGLATAGMVIGALNVVLVILGIQAWVTIMIVSIALG